jgi:hypothetical protein
MTTRPTSALVAFTLAAMLAGCGAHGGQGRGGGGEARQTCVGRVKPAGKRRAA